MDRVIITGVNGFVGTHLVNELVDQGFEVIGVGREESLIPELAQKVREYHTCDLSDYDQVAKLPLSQAKGLINLAGLAAVGPSFDQPELYMRVNTAVLDTVCRAAIEQKTTGLRVLSISSGAVYSPRQPMPLTEESQLAPDSSPYAASKIAMEELSLKYHTKGLDCVVARPFNHIGPGQLPGFILPDLYQKIVEAKNNGQKTISVGNLTTRRDYTDVRDVAKAYVKLITAGSLGHSIYNVCTGRSVSGEEMLTMLLDELRAVEIVPHVDESLLRPSDSQELYGDNTRLTTDTGWSPGIDIKQTLADFVDSKK
jgi:GDP-4-dehydro-6-deoxy-D-mannose reductase